ncbi:MAG: GTPase Der [Candidatus Peregrinibacteria bacterium GW2011_GWA2_47_7]|nr:MAG: GTPase Der [Candidatus Peregrinibacteria bacterium GW2011_GWA2_47_7]
MIAIVGRPNVGKSTLFNKLIGKRYSITSHLPGTTRDRVSHLTHFGSFSAILVDTGGLDFEAKSDLEEDVYTQAQIAIQDADLIYFVVDSSEELTTSDYEAATLLRKSKKTVFLVVNKCDARREEHYNFYELGFGDSFSISALHNYGIDELRNKTEKIFLKDNFKPYRVEKDRSSIGLAFLGRPNVGKSSLVNALLGEKRLIVSATPGTTVDATDTEIVVRKDKFVLIDTAGLRRRGKIEGGVERYSSFRALQALYRADIALLVLDHNDGINKQDCHVSQYVLEAGKGLIIVVNKSDTMEDAEKDRDRYIHQLMRKMSYVPWAPVIFVSALTKENIFTLFELALNITIERQKRIDDRELMLFITHLIAQKPPPSKGKSFVKITKAKQTNTEPPEFTFVSNHPDSIHFSYRRFIENELRKKYSFNGTALRLRFRNRLDRDQADKESPLRAKNARENSSRRSRS